MAIGDDNIILTSNDVTDPSGMYRVSGRNLCLTKLRKQNNNSSTLWFEEHKNENSNAIGK